MDNLTAIKIYDMLTLYGLKVIAAILIIIIGRWIATGVRSITRKLMKKSEVEQTLISFTGNIVYVALLSFVAISALEVLEIKTTSFVAILGAAGLAIGLALRGTLANLAAGVLLIIFKPFKVGDIVECSGASGSVKQIGTFTTELRTSDNTNIFIPNSKITGDNITNLTCDDTRCIDIVVSVNCDNDLDKAKKILQDITTQDNRILKTPNPIIAITKLSGNSVNFDIRLWAKTPNYWNVFSETQKEIKNRFDAEGISALPAQ